MADVTRLLEGEAVALVMEVSRIDESERDGAIISMAISLKRIADALERIEAYGIRPNG